MAPQVPSKPPSALARLQQLTLSRALSVLLLALALLMALYLLARDGRALAWQVTQLNLPLALASFGVACLGLLTAIPAWRRILASYGVHQSWRDDIRIYCYSALAFILPGGIWSMVSRSSLYHRLGVELVPVATASLVETLIMGVAAMLVYGVAVWLQPAASVWQRPEIGVMFALVVLVLVQPRVFNRVLGWAFRRAKGQGAARAVSFRGREVMLWVLLESGAVVTGGIALFMLLSSVVMVPGEFLVRMIAVWAITSAVGNLFFWLPGTFLFRDGVLVVALSASLPLSLAVLIALFARVWMIGSLLFVAGVVWLLIDRSAWRRTAPR